MTEAVLLSLVALLAAWSGFAATRWSTESRLDLAASSSARGAATRAGLCASSLVRMRPGTNSLTSNPAAGTVSTVAGARLA